MKRLFLLFLLPLAACANTPPIMCEKAHDELVMIYSGVMWTPIFTSVCDKECASDSQVPVCVKQRQERDKKHG